MNTKSIFLTITVLSLALSPLSAISFDEADQAIINDDMDAFQQFISVKKHLSERDSDGDTLVLHLARTAIIYFHKDSAVEYIKLAEKAGARLDVFNEASNKELSFCKWTVLMAAAYSGDADLTNYLLKKGGQDLYYKGQTKMGAFDLACFFGQLNIVKILFPKLKNKTQTGEYPFFQLALAAVSEDVGLYLLANGCDPMVDKPVYRSTLNTLVDGDHPRLLKEFLKRDINWETQSNGEYPITIAVQKSYLAAKALIDKKVNLSRISEDLQLDLLQLAIKKGDYLTVQLLIGAGFSSKTPGNTNGMTPVEFAKSNKMNFLLPYLDGSKVAKLPSWTLDDQILTNFRLDVRDRGDLKFDTLDGKKSKISDQKGKVVLMNVWATWCPPCVAEIPSLVSFFEKYRKKNVSVFGVSIDENLNDLTDFVDENEINYPMYIIKPAYLSTTAFEKNGVPMTYLIDKGGRVIGYFEGETDFMTPGVQTIVDYALSL